jgi:hypothetical protein
MMSHNELGILTPSPSQIERYVREYEKEEGFTDTLIYRRCLKDMRKIELCRISEEQSGQIVKTFLRNWGLMGRVLPQGTEWIKELTDSIRQNCSVLESVRDSNLRDIELSRVEDNIEKCYRVIKSDVLGPTGVVKTLHLISPNFFPLWDTKIREKVSKETSLKKRPIGDTAIGYYKFMVEMKEFLEKYSETLSELSKEYGWTELKIVDEYLFKITR